MSTGTIEARREAIWAITETFVEMHRVAVEEGDEALSEAILAQHQALYEQAARNEQEAVKEARELAEAHSTLFLSKLKGAKTRILHQAEKLGRAQN